MIFCLMDQWIPCPNLHHVDVPIAFDHVEINTEGFRLYGESHLWSRCLWSEMGLDLLEECSWRFQRQRFQGGSGHQAMLRSISCGHGRLTIGKSPHIPTENHNEPHWARVGSPLCKAWYCKQAATLDFLGVSCLIFPQRPEHYQSPLLHIRQRHTSWCDQAKKSKSCIPVLQPDKNRTESLKAQGRPRFWSSWPNYTAASQKVEFGLWCHEGTWVFLACDIGLAPALQLDKVIHDQKCIFKSFQICSFRMSNAQLLRVLLRNILSVVLQEKSSQCGPWRKQRNLSSSVLIFQLTGFTKHRPKFAVSLHVEWFETSWRKKNHLHKTIGFNDLQKMSMLSQRFLLLFYFVIQWKAAASTLINTFSTCSTDYKLRHTTGKCVFSSINIHDLLHFSALWKSHIHTLTQRGPRLVFVLLSCVGGMHSHSPPSGPDPRTRKQASSSWQCFLRALC